MTKYDDEEWESLLKADSGDWSREETDYLFELCERFDLRFTVIADRWDFTTAAAAGAAGAAVSTQRSVEDLKERYYSISRKLLMAREGNEALIANQTLVKYPFNANHERQRKTALEGLMARTNKQLQEENKLLAEAHRIEEVRAREAVAAGGITPGSAGAAARKAAAAVAASPRAGGKALSPGLLTADVKLAAAFPNVVAPEEPSLLGPDVQPVRPRPGVYARGLHAKDMAATMYNSLPGGQRAAKALEASLAELNFPMALEGPSHRSRAVCGSWLALRAEALALIELRRQAQARAYGDGRKAEKRKR